MDRVDLYNQNEFYVNMSCPPKQNIILDKIEKKLEFENNNKFDFIDDNNFLILQTFLIQI